MVQRVASNNHWIERRSRKRSVRAAWYHRLRAGDVSSYILLPCRPAHFRLEVIVLTHGGKLCMGLLAVRSVG
jgi:hypothetical protein